MKTFTKGIGNFLNQLQSFRLMLTLSLLFAGLQGISQTTLPQPAPGPGFRENNFTFGSIGNRVWADTDGDGIQDASEANGISGVTVQLKNSAGVVIATTTTDEDGEYEFDGLTAGNYTVQFPTSVGGFGLSPALVGSNRDVDSNPATATGATAVIALAANQDIKNVDAGYMVDCDCTNSTSNLLVNGSFEDGSNGWSSSGGTVTIGTEFNMCGTKNGYLNHSSGTARIWQDITIAGGAIVSLNGYAGTHSAGLSCSPKLSLIYYNSANAVISQVDVNVTYDVGSGSTLSFYSIHNNVAPATAVKVRVQGSITCNTLKLDGLCLNVSSGSIGDKVWSDLDSDGLQDAGEAGISGVQIQLKNSGGTVIATTTTSASGAYTFSGLAAGTYTVVFPTSTGGNPLTTANVGANDDIDSDASTTTGSTGNIVLVPGQVVTNVDAGYKPAPVYNPDFNVTYVNVSVPGNVRTNDVVPAGTTYGTTPTLISNPAGSTQTLTMLSTGTYTFVANRVGVYVYNVPVCVPGQAAPCPNTLLTITVLDGNVSNNPPVANTDVAYTKINTPVVLNTLANDKAGNPGGSLTPSSVLVTVAALHGTSSINPANGNNTYTPTTGYVGYDTLTYRVCDNSTPALCATAKQIILVLPVNVSNTTMAADDYASTPVNIPVSGNAKTNDTDPEGNTQTVTAQTTTVAGKGTLVLATTGAFTFTPVAGFTGPVSFVYTTCDNGTPQACANATIYILVMPEVPMTNPDFNSTWVNITVPGNVSTNDKVPAGTTYGTTPTLVSSPAGSVKTLTMNSNGTYTFVANMPGVYTYDVPVCVPGQVAPCPPTALVITVLNSTVNTNPPVANVDIATTLVNTPVTLKTLVNDAAGNVGNSLVPSSVTVTVAPLHGTVTVDALTGNTTYTPATGYIGFDILTYSVCDNQGVPKCATAKQVILVRPTGLNNTTVAADDYKITPLNTVATGNVKTNDSDPEGNTQTVTAQTTTVATKGTVVILADGSYTFTPVTGFFGPVDFPYTTCDNGVPVACASATLHILVRPEALRPDLSPNITAIPNIMHGTTTFNVTVTTTELLGNQTDGSTVLIRIPRDPRVTFTYNPALTNIGFTAVSNSAWIYDGTDPIFHLFRTTTVIAGNGSSTFGFVATFTPGQSQGKYTLSSSLNSGSGGETITNNNQDAEIIDYFIN